MKVDSFKNNKYSHFYVIKRTPRKRQFLLIFIGIFTILHILHFQYIEFCGWGKIEQNPLILEIDPRKTPQKKIFRLVAPLGASESIQECWQANGPS